MLRVVSHQMEREIRLHPLVNGVDFAFEDVTVHVTGNEVVHFGIQHDQVAVHFAIQSHQNNRIDWRGRIADSAPNTFDAAQVDMGESAVDGAQCFESFSIPSFVQVVINANYPSGIGLFHCRRQVPQRRIVAAEDGSVVGISVQRVRHHFLVITSQVGFQTAPPESLAFIQSQLISHRNEFSTVAQR